MKRSLIYLLVAVVIAGILGTLVARDPGYVLVSYGGFSMQTSLWVMLALMAALVAALYYGLRLFNIVGQSMSAWRTWRVNRAAGRAAKLTARGLLYFQQGEFERAERFLQSGAARSEGAAINFIYAARAADAQGKPEQREAYLRRAREADSDAGQAVAIATAEMAVGHREYQKALDALEEVNDNPSVNRLKSHALLETRNWQALSELMPALQKSGMGSDEIQALQKRVAIERLTAQSTTNDALSAIYRKLPAEIQQDADVALAYCRAFTNETEAEAAVRAVLKQSWHPEVVALYGGLGRETLARRIKTAEAWQKQHPDDAALQLCLGQLYEANGDKERALAAYQRSIDLNQLPDASKHLGRLLAFEGDYRKSNEYLIRALNAQGQ